MASLLVTDDHQTEAKMTGYDIAFHENVLDQLPAVKVEGPWSRELIKEIAADIGKDTVAYVEVMYPKAIEATSSTFKLSLRNHIHNQVMAAIELRDETGVRSWLAARKKHRREWLGIYRKMRKADEVAPLGKSAEMRAITEKVALCERGWLPNIGYVKNVTFTIEEAETVEKALNLLAELEDRTIDGLTT